MASEEKKLPNLKICIDNDDDRSDNEEEFAIKVEEENEEDQEPEIETRVDSEEEADLFGDSPKKTMKPKASKQHVSASSNSGREIRKYENRAGEFVTGFDLTSAEQVEKREKRAKRFGIENQATSKPVDEEKLKALYEKLGCADTEDVRGIRREAIHLRGVDNMSTSDVFRYFDKYPPGEIEWIDDSSCNVVWKDQVCAARAMLSLSQNPESDISDEEGSGDESGANDKPAPDTSSQTEDSENQRTEEKMEDDDELNLMSSSDEDGEGKEAKQKKKAEKSSSSPQPMSTETSTAPSTTTKSSQKKHRKNIIVPPGKWRVGRPCNRSGFLFLRFATKADKKLPGAERKSQYYRKYGNPNYGGMTGIISESRKRRMQRDAQKRGMEARDIINKRSHIDQIDEEEEYYLGLESEGLSMFDIHLREAQQRLQAQQRKEEMEKRHKDREELKKSLGKRKKTSSDSSEESDVEIDEDIAALLKPAPAKRYMRMYADDIEDEVQTKQSKTYKGAISVTAKSSIHSRLSGNFRPTQQPSSEEEDEEDQEYADEYRSRGMTGDLRRRLNRPKFDAGRSTSFRSRDLKRLRVEVEQD